MYKLGKILFIIFTSLFYPVEIEGLDNIPLEGGVVLAGNHRSNMDGIFLTRVLKRQIHFIIKKELEDGLLGFAYKKAGFISVDRTSKNNKDKLNKAIDLLNNNEVIGIFPEGTFNKTEYIIRPFKIGACYLASESNAKIVPFAISEVKMFHKTKIVFGKSYNITDKHDLRKENITLMNKVIRLLDELD